MSAGILQILDVTRQSSRLLFTLILATDQVKLQRVYTLHLGETLGDLATRASRDLDVLGDGSAEKALVAIADGVAVGQLLAYVPPVADPAPSPAQVALQAFLRLYAQVQADQRGVAVGLLAADDPDLLAARAQLLKDYLPTYRGVL